MFRLTGKNLYIYVYVFISCKLHFNQRKYYTVTHYIIVINHHQFNRKHKNLKNIKTPIVPFITECSSVRFYDTSAPTKVDQLIVLTILFPQSSDRNVVTIGSTAISTKYSKMLRYSLSNTSVYFSTRYITVLEIRHAIQKLITQLA